MNTEEITDIALTEDQEKMQVETIVSASLANIQSNREILEGVAMKYKGLKIDGIEDKANYKLVSAGITATRSGRTTVTKLVKGGKSLLDKAKKRLDEEGDALIAIVSPIEAELKAEKERIDTLKEEAEQERLRLLEEQKQARIATLFELGLSFNGSGYAIGDLTITSLEVTQFTQAQWEGFIAQAKVEFEAIQLKEAEEKAERERQAEELRKQQEALQAQNAAKQKELEAQKAAMQQMLDERTEGRIELLRSKSFTLVELRNCYEFRDFIITNAFIEEANKQEWNDKIAAADKYIAEVQLIKPGSGLNGVSKPHVEPLPIPEPKPIVEENDISLDEVFGASELEPADDYTQTVELKFTKANPFIDAKVGKSTLRIYTEQFLDEANTGLTKEMVAVTGEINSDLLFIVIKP